MVLLPQHGVFAQEKRLHCPKSSEPSVAKVDDWNLLIYLDQQTSIPLPAHQTPAVSTVDEKNWHFIRSEPIPQARHTSSAPPIDASTSWGSNISRN